MDFSSTETPEDYKSPFNFERGVNTNYLYLSPSDSVTPPGSPVFSAKGASRPEPIPEVGEDAVSTVSLSAPALTEEEQEELRAELAKVEDEIQTLSQVLAAKEKHVAEIKRKLGISPLNELKQNITKGWQDMTASTAYKKTSETLSQAGQKATAAFSSVGSAITKKLEDVRNSPTFKSFEEKVETLKTKVSSQPPTGDFGEVLNSAASASATDAKPEETPVESQGAH
uniref:Tumor protein D52 n=1 Tax=Lepisosteus oculatus TaxID=7918 RepID=W5M4L7_LEPOC|nr:PREDICTED: tumor protein D52 isoform X3 [Lepisosteus oculatus]